MGRSLPCPSSLDGLIFSSIVAAGRCADPLHCEMEDQDPLVNVEEANMPQRRRGRPKKVLAGIPSVVVIWL